MSFENFSGFNSAEPMSESSFEAFKERMAAAAAQIAELRKKQKKQKKQEDQLVRILLSFIQNSNQSDLVLLISYCLQVNIPAAIILAIVQLISPEIRQTLEVQLLPPGNVEESNGKELAFFNSEDLALPLKLRIALDNWLKYLLVQAEEYSEKLLKTAYQVEEIKVNDPNSAFQSTKTEYKKSIRTQLIQLTAYVFERFFIEQNAPKPNNSIQNFANFIIKGVLEKTEENINSRKLLN